MSYHQIFNIVHTVGLLFAGLVAFSPNRSQSADRIRVLRGALHDFPEDFRTLLSNDNDVFLKGLTAQICKQHKGECFDCPLRVCHQGED